MSFDDEVPDFFGAIGLFLFEWREEFGTLEAMASHLVDVVGAGTARRAIEELDVVLGWTDERIIELLGELDYAYDLDRSPRDLLSEVKRAVEGVLEPDP